MPNEPTREELLAQVASLKAELAQRPHAARPLSTAELPPSPFVQEVAHPIGPNDTPPHKTSQVVGPTPQQLALARALDPRRRLVKSTPEELLEMIGSIKSVIVSGVNSAGYGDKRTEFRSLSELRQILNGLEEELDGLLGNGGRIRQIRMTTQADKGL